MTLSEEAKATISEESKILESITSALINQKKRGAERLSIESSRARELTSTLVATRRLEDKAMLASDEAVSHGLRDKLEQDQETLAGLIKKPYFARLVVSEDLKGSEKQLEYRIGFAENSECRIVDWRKAPIARLYYEYKEGDEYSEEILGRERNGTIALRNSLEIVDSKLTRVSCRYGTFEKSGEEWKEIAARKARSQESDSSYHLPQIAALLTPEQYTLIAESSDRAMLIQGIAGSGKTTVALHRLAFQFGPKNSDPSEIAELPDPARCVVLVISNTLREYVSKTLPSLGVSAVRAITLKEWLAETVSRLFPQFCISLSAEELEHKGYYAAIQRPQAKTPLTIERVFRSLALLRSLEELSLSPSTRRDPATFHLSLLQHALSDPARLIEKDETKLLDKATIAAALAHLQKNLRARCLDESLDALLVRAEQLLSGTVFLRTGEKAKYQHIVADEVQDFSPVDLACVIGSVSDARGLTLVGDTGQKVSEASTFPGWDKLRRYWAFKESMSQFINLNLSYRSTAQISALAEYIRNRAVLTTGDGRQGRPPIWFMCDDEQQALKAAIDWLQTACTRYPHVLSAIIARTPAASKELFRLLQPAFGPLIRMGDEYSFTFAEGIVVTNAEQVKGLEFMNVLLWQPSQREYPDNDINRNLLYVATTRAEENLAIVTYSKPSPLLPAFRSPLTRPYDLRAPLDEVAQNSSQSRKERD